MDPRNGGGWKCIDASETTICPGKFNTGKFLVSYSIVILLFIAECECKGDSTECPIGECQCDGQLRVSHDCKTAKYDS